MEIVRTGAFAAGGPASSELIGAEHGAAVTLLVEDLPAGRGPKLHDHPYPECWVVVSGEAEFTDGMAVRIATAGDVVYVAAGEAHRFTARTPLRMICIHQAPRFDTRWLE